MEKENYPISTFLLCDRDLLGEIFIHFSRWQCFSLTVICDKYSTLYPSGTKLKNISIWKNIMFQFSFAIEELCGVQD